MEASNLRDMSLDSLLLWMGRSQPNSIDHEAGGDRAEAVKTTRGNSSAGFR
jgi:hypothetical protein